ncbi:MAG: T9SS type A sorting domain-containing protein [Candidatus Cloacimonetes bacterium]|nr:T9SS type A sorting domain-containing protein [Candidatus Cloacimonadota bacterium]
MKRLFVVFLCLGTLSAMFANPPAPTFIGKIWFNELSQPQLQFRPNMEWYETTTVTVNDGYDDYNYSVDFTAPPPIIITLPSDHLTRQSGYIGITVFGLFSDTARWGESLTNHFSPLNGTECAVRYFTYDWDSSYPRFAKDYNPTSGEFMNPSARSTIDVYCHDLSGAPVVNVPITSFESSIPLVETDANGHSLSSVFSSKMRITIQDQLNQATILDTTFFAEPGQSYSIDVCLAHSASDDPVLQAPRGNFSIYPSVLRVNQDYTLHLNYDSKLVSAQVELYDLKGRLLAKQDYTNDGMTWQVPKLASGIYFVRLSSGSRNLGNSKLIVLK